MPRISHIGSALVLLVAAGAARAETPAELRGGDVCIATKSVAVKPAKGKAGRLKIGARVDVISTDSKTATVKTAAISGVVKLADLKSGCRRPSASESADALPALEPPPRSSLAKDLALIAPPGAQDLALVPLPQGDISQSIVESRAARERDATDKVRVAVMTVRGSQSIPPEVLDSLTALIPQVLDDLGPFKSITANDIQQMLAMEELKQSLGCDDLSCLAEIGGAIGADYVISGSVLVMGETFLLQFQLMNIKEARVAARTTRDYTGGPKGLLEEVRIATKTLVRDILAQKSGTLALEVSEEGATIKLDGTIIGVSPLPPLEVAGGMHTVSVEKEGFVLFSRDVEVQAKAERRLEIALLPSAEFKRQYLASSGLVRSIAYVAIGVGVVGVGGGVAMYVMGSAEAEDLKKDVVTYNAPEHVRTAAEEKKLNERRRSLGALDTLTVVAGGVGIAALATGVILLVNGDDPHRFDGFTETGVVPSSVGVAPLFGGGIVVLSW